MPTYSVEVRCERVANVQLQTEVLITQFAIHLTSVKFSHLFPHTLQYSAATVSRFITAISSQEYLMCQDKLMQKSSEAVPFFAKCGI